MNADNIPLGELTDLDHAALKALAKRQDVMLARTIGWSKINTGSHNSAGLQAFAPMLALSLIHISSPRDLSTSRMPSSA